MALTLVAVAIFLSSNRPLLRSTPRMLQGAAIVNVGACLVWYLAAGFASDAPSDGAAGHLFGQLLLAGVVGTLGLVPVALTQNAAMDRLGVPPAPERAMRERADTKVLPSTPVDRLRLYAVFGLFAFGFLYVVGGLAYRQLIQSNDLKEQSDNQSRRIVLRPPARGRIYDRNGFVLVDNRARWSVKADLAALQKEFRTEYLRLLAAERARQAVQVDTERVMELARVNVLQGWLNKVWFVIDENQRKTVRKPAPGKSSPLAAPGERKVNIEDLRKHLRERRALPFTLVADLAFPIANVPAGPDEGVKAVARFIEQFPVEGPIRLESDIIRTYPYGGMAAHVLGYVQGFGGAAAQRRGHRRGPAANRCRSCDRPARPAPPAWNFPIDHVLKGLSGWELWTKTSSGYNQTRLKYSEPVQGSNIPLSLDLRIQRTTENALAEIKDSQGVPLPAAAVMLDVQTGEILALASQPTFDPNRLAGSDHRQPLRRSREIRCVVESRDPRSLPARLDLQDHHRDRRHAEEGRRLGRHPGVRRLLSRRRPRLPRARARRLR